MKIQGYRLVADKKGQVNQQHAAAYLTPISGGQTAALHMGSLGL
jgi:hypothetical protein